MENTYLEDRLELLEEIQLTEMEFKCKYEKMEHFLAEEENDEKQDELDEIAMNPPSEQDQEWLKYEAELNNRDMEQDEDLENDEDTSYGIVRNGIEQNYEVKETMKKLFK